ncbi:MAG TPA: hypothetical protein VIK33_02440 [Anaerolineae bacterium]
MKRPYDQRFSPPAPALTIDIFVPDNANQRDTILAKLDTAADISAIPLDLLKAWRLEPESEIVISGIDAAPTTVRTYTVGIELPDARIRRSEVIPIAEDYALIGRDILNHFYIYLNGPDLTFEIQAPRTVGSP